MNNILANAKAYAALVGALCTGLLGVYAADSKVGQVLTVASIVATAVVTWSVPNTPKPADERGNVDAALILIVLTFVGVVLLLFRIRF
jgi:CBS-domain-containing membrane protein